MFECLQGTRACLLHGCPHVGRSGGFCSGRASWGHGAVPLLDEIKTTCVEWLFQVFPKRARPGLYTHPHALITYPVLNTNNDYRS